VVVRRLWVGGWVGGNGGCGGHWDGARNAPKINKKINFAGFHCWFCSQILFKFRFIFVLFIEKKCYSKLYV